MRNEDYSTKIAVVAFLVLILLGYSNTLFQLGYVMGSEQCVAYDFALKINSNPRCVNISRLDSSGMDMDLQCAVNITVLKSVNPNYIQPLKQRSTTEIYVGMSNYTEQVQSDLGLVE